MHFNNGRQVTRQSKVEQITVEITPQDRRDYYNTASAFQNAVNQLKQRFQGTRDISSFEQAVRRESTAIVTPLVDKMGVDKFDALQAEYRFSVTTFETIINTAWDWGQRNINRNPRGFHGAGVISDMSPHEEAEFAQELARTIQNYRTTDRVTFVRESGGPRGIYELISVGNTPIQQSAPPSHTNQRVVTNSAAPGVNFFAPYYSIRPSAGGPTLRQGFPTRAELPYVTSARPEGQEGPLISEKDLNKHFDYYNQKYGQQNTNQKTDDGSNR